MNLSEIKQEMCSVGKGFFFHLILSYDRNELSEALAIIEKGVNLYLLKESDFSAAVKLLKLRLGGIKDEVT